MENGPKKKFVNRVYTNGNIIKKRNKLYIYIRNNLMLFYFFFSLNTILIINIYIYIYLNYIIKSCISPNNEICNERI